MRGDLVYEKLGEIDPELIADALPDAVPLYRLGGENPLPPKKRPNFRKALVICACLLLAGLLLVGGGIALSRSLEFPLETDTDEAPTDQGKELTYQGTVTIDGLPSLTGSDDLTAMGDEIKARFSAATFLEDACECDRDLPIQIGEDALTYNRDHGCFRDGKTGKVYRLRDEDRAYMEELLVMLEPPVIMDYTHATLHPLDAYTCTVSLVKNEDYPNVYEIKEIYLRATAEGSDYRTDSFREIPDRDSFYCGTIPEDAPEGDYELVVYLFTPYTGRYTELTLTSPTPAVTVAAHEKEPRYDFFYECEKKIFRQDEAISLTAGLINSGDDIYRWSTELSILPTVTLRTVLDGETLTYPMTTGLESEWSGELYHMTYNQSSKAEFQTVTPDRLPVGVYDLVLSFEGHEKVFEAVFRIMDTVILHRGDSYGLTAFRGSSYRVTLKQGDYEIRFSKAGGVPMGNIDSDAPAGWYDLIYTDVPAGWEDREESIIHILKDFVYIPDEDMDIKLESDIGQVTVKPGDVFSCKVTVINQGNPINLYMPYDGMGVDVGLESRYNGTSTSASASPVQDDRQPDNYTFGTGESFTNTHTFYLRDNFPEGIYDLVMIWRGITVVIEDAVIVEKP